jgi:hypothetical protein
MLRPKHLAAILVGFGIAPIGMGLLLAKAKEENPSGGLLAATGDVAAKLAPAIGAFALLSIDSLAGRE